MITEEIYVVLLDAVPMIIAMGTFVFAPSAKLLRDQGAKMKIDGTLYTLGEEGIEKPTVKRGNSDSTTDVEGQVPLTVTEQKAYP